MKKLLILLGLVLMCTVVFVGCGEDEWDPYEGQVKVVYELEGGTYRETTGAVTLYYAFDEGEHLIQSPDVLSRKDFSRPDYKLEGWYRTRTENGGTVEYADKWDFSKDKVTSEGVTLYAKWVKLVTYTYEVCYRDEDGTTKVIDKYVVDEGRTFRDFLKYASKRRGYTHLGGYYQDADCTTPWDDAFTHPGGDTDTAVQVYADYIKGDYTIVRTAKELSNAVTKNIYLMNDIDFEGKNFSGFGDYKGTIMGNGYRVTNFKLARPIGKDALFTDKALSENNETLLAFSLFKSLTGATISDITFENYTMEIGVGLVNETGLVLAAPLAMKMSGATLTNVTVSGTYILGTNMDKFDTEKVSIKTDVTAYWTDAEKPTTGTGVTVSMTQGSTPAPQA